MLPDSLRDFYNSSPMREGVLCWYPFERSASVLDLSGGALTEMLQDRCEHVISEDAVTDALFDYIVLLDPLDFSIEAMKSLRMKLNPHGRLLLAYENPFALRYWSGKSSPITHMPYDALLSRDNRASKAEMQTRLKQAGFEGKKWYYPLTDHWFTSEVYSDSYLPNEYLSQRFKPYIADEPNLAFDERSLYREIIRNGSFEFMCGAYLVEARANANDEPCVVEYAAVTAYREPSKRFVTTVCSNGKVYKIPLHPDGRETIRKIQDNHAELERLGINVVPISIEDNSIVMPRLYLPTLWDYWVQKLLDGTFDESEMFKQFDRIRDDINTASATGKCFWEFIPANCFYDEVKDELIYFDQEYYWEGESPDIAVARAVLALSYSQAFTSDPRTRGWRAKLKTRYGIADNWEELFQLADIKTREEVFGDGEKALEAMTLLAVDTINERTPLVRRRKRFAPVLAKLQSLGYTRPIIYGYGRRGKELLHELVDADIEITAIIDRENRGLSDISQVPAGAKADIIIVSILDSAEIISELKDKTTLPVVSLEELV